METRKAKALANYLDIDLDEVEESSYDSDVFDADGCEYMVLTSKEATEKAKDYIRDSLWAFNADFLIGFTDLPYDAKEMISDYQEKHSEDANEAVFSLVEKRFKDLVRDAILTDGRGHFLSQYDGEEIEENDYYIYRTN